MVVVGLAVDDPDKPAPRILWGAGQVLLLEGEAGVGKTRLLMNSGLKSSRPKPTIDRRTESEVPGLIGVSESRPGLPAFTPAQPLVGGKDSDADRYSARPSSMAPSRSRARSIRSSTPRASTRTMPSSAV